MLGGKQRPEFTSGSFDTKFEHDGVEIRYILEYQDGKVLNEEVTVDSKKLLERGKDGIGEIYFVSLEKMIAFQTPVTEIAAVARRDSIQHPFLEQFAEWGKGVRFYSFGSDLGRATVGIIVSNSPEADPSDGNAAISLFRRGEKEYPTVFENAVLSDMCTLGYPIEKIGTCAPTAIKFEGWFNGTPVHLFVKEKELSCNTEQIEMSQGMFRALALVVHLNYAALSTTPSCIVVDDIGEGLDFERSCLLIDLVRQKVQKSSSQLIMSTNDRFVMNKVPLDEWVVLQRKGGNLLARNSTNSKREFDDFKFTGLSNFDFFASEFLLQEENGASINE